MKVSLCIINIRRLDIAVSYIEIRRHLTIRSDRELISVDSHIGFIEKTRTVVHVTSAELRGLRLRDNSVHQPGPPAMLPQIEKCWRLRADGLGAIRV
jgi:hypothetical protein